MPTEPRTESIDVSAAAMIVPAAGRSTRMGRCKAAIELDGRALIEHLIDAAQAAGVTNIVVVVGHHAEVVAPIAERLGATVAVNRDPDQGRTGSVQVGLAAAIAGAGGDPPAAFIQPVDCPLVLPRTLASLAACLASAGADVAVPEHRGRDGHPPLIRDTLFGPIVSAGPDHPLRDLLRSPSARRVTMPTDDPAVLLNVDRPQDLADLTALYDTRRG